MSASRPVPRADAPARDIWTFALSYHAYIRDGTVRRTQELGAATRRHWDADGALPTNVAELRRALFFEARRRHFDGGELSGVDEVYVRELVAAMGERSRGRVTDDDRPLRRMIEWGLMRLGRGQTGA